MTTLARLLVILCQLFLYSSVVIDSRRSVSTSRWPLVIHPLLSVLPTRHVLCCYLTGAPGLWTGTRRSLFTPVLSLSGVSGWHMAVQDRDKLELGEYEIGMWRVCICATYHRRTTSLCVCVCSLLFVHLYTERWLGRWTGEWVYKSLKITKKENQKKYKAARLNKTSSKRSY